MLPWASLKNWNVFTVSGGLLRDMHQTVLSMVGWFDDREALLYLKHFSSFRNDKKKNEFTCIDEAVIAFSQ